MAQSFRTIEGPSSGFFKDRGSKFFSYAYQVNSIDQVKDILEKIKKEYYDARHHCFAHILGLGTQSVIRANDDGEPRHSAGDPILGQIQSFDLTNTLVVVVRYFGGTKLGVSGLVAAYREAARDALCKANIISRVILQRFIIEYGYEKTGDVERILSEFKTEIVEQKFSEKCYFVGNIDPDRFPSFTAKMALINVIVH